MACSSNPVRSGVSSSAMPGQPIQMPPRLRNTGASAPTRPPDPGLKLHRSPWRVSTTGSRFETTMRRCGEFVCVISVTWLPWGIGRHPRNCCGHATVDTRMDIRSRVWPGLSGECVWRLLVPGRPGRPARRCAGRAWAGFIPLFHASPDRWARKVRIGPLGRMSCAQGAFTAGSHRLSQETIRRRGHDRRARSSGCAGRILRDPR